MHEGNEYVWYRVEDSETVPGVSLMGCLLLSQRGRRYRARGLGGRDGSQ